ncbi:MAG TPA: DoxX family protein [Vicinamibacterales bacterium]|nr:DoxX family protein [Vicinamibacterales bacterium]
MAAIGLLTLRITLAVVFVAHGLHDLFGFFSGSGVGPGGLDQQAAYYTALGLRPGFAIAVLAGITKFAGGLLLIPGFATRWASLALVVYLGVAVWSDYRRWGFFLNWTGAPGMGQGVEYALVLIAALVCLMLTGGGEYSLDGRRSRSAESRAAARDRVRRKF